MEICIGSYEAPARDRKGKNLLEFASDYTVIDTETTGLEPAFDEMIEFSAIRIRDGKETDRLQTLIKPENPVDEYIEDLTGITNEMLADAPKIGEAMPRIFSFIGNDILVGHNTNFDINFLYDAAHEVLGRPIENDFVDTMRLSRYLLPELPHHRLRDLAEAFQVPQPVSHRAMADCETAKACYEALAARARQDYGSEADFVQSVKHRKNLKLNELTTEKTEFDTSHPLYGKHCVFTGALQKMTRAQAGQMVVDLGGFADNGVTKKTNFLILGNNDYCKSIKDGKSSKQKKAEQYKLDGQDIEIIPESVFYELISQE